jgi:hypothetical protein
MADDELIAENGIAVKPNNCCTNDPCSICGSRCDPCGLDYYVAGTWSMVCDACALQRAPMIGAIREYVRGYANGRGCGFPQCNEDVWQELRAATRS